MLKLVRRIANALSWRLRGHWAAWRARVTSDAALESGPARRILVVCYGNIYRSPYAAALLGRLLDCRAEVRSGGFHAVTGRPSPEAVVRIAASCGLDLASHRSTQVGAADVAQADLVVVMDRHNWQAVRTIGGASRVAWLGAMDGRGELRDPYGRGDEELRAVIERLHRCTELLAQRLAEHRGSAAA